MTPSCGMHTRRSRECHWCSYHTFWRLSSITKQTHDNMESFCFIWFKKKKKAWYESKFLLKVTLYLRLCIDRSWLRTIQNAWADEGKARINFHAQKSRVTKTTVIVSPLVWDSIVRHCDRFSPEKIAFFFPKKRFERASKHLEPSSDRHTSRWKNLVRQWSMPS